MGVVDIILIFYYCEDMPDNGYNPDDERVTTPNTDLPSISFITCKLR